MADLGFAKPKDLPRVHLIALLICRLFKKVKPEHTP